MNNKYFNLYNNLIKLTRNKSLYKKYTKNETFSDRLVIFFFHLAFLLKVYTDRIKYKRNWLWRCNSQQKNERLC